MALRLGRIVLYIKPTDRCNIRCLHCFIPDSRKGQIAVLQLDHIKTIASKLSAIEAPEIRVVWHGGEPTLAGIDFFRGSKEALETSFNGKNARLSHSLQSNIIGLDESWVPLIHDMFSGRIGTSFDPEIRLLHGSYEKFKKKWFSNLEMLRKGKVYLSVNITITKPVVEKGVEYLFSLFDEIGVREYHLERFTPRGVGKVNSDLLYLADREFYGFLTEVAERYLKGKYMKEIDYYLSPINSFYLNIPEETGSSCWGGKCMETALTINPDGSVSNCPDLAVESKDHSFGNIFKDNIEDILYSFRRIRLIGKQRGFVCDCPHLNICNGGCPLHFHGGDKVFCRSFFTEFRKQIKKYPVVFDFASREEGNGTYENRMVSQVS